MYPSNDSGYKDDEINSLRIFNCLQNLESQLFSYSYVNENL